MYKQTARDCMMGKLRIVISTDTVFSRSSFDHEIDQLTRWINLLVSLYLIITYIHGIPPLLQRTTNHNILTNE